MRAIAAAEHTDPFGRKTRVSRQTLDRWIRDWRAGGFDALVPSPRQTHQRTPVEVMELAVALRRENPERTAAGIRRILRAQLGWSPDERTLQRHFTRLGLTGPAADAGPSVFGRFEAARPNELWTGDDLCRYRHKSSYADGLFMPILVALCLFGSAAIRVRSA
ncbi:helix-turn-helix domain-containing protein [Kibdelosporangium philippinense]|uniref:Helix-turn-helix domain-containing protein n=1 Tax=Kibdelosporangium philippinense TaxID=211113 RepID=A0ABS8ZAJ4_9PSEU|nr:helix-turn-helix domain-containing protein [Kibdelosporangium philippinense]MCE7004532.1 helix-turn-helix domain-containing protein [Kibdelosporangium philippinense]